jgi:hypothetical protein
MSGSLAEKKLAVILASVDAAGTFRGNLQRWCQELDGHGEVLVVDSSRDGTADEIAASFPRVRVLRREPGWLAPELWRDGLEATDAPLVAISTTRMSPAPGWRRAMLETLEATGAAVVGGPIEPSGSYGRDHVSMAIYLLRYINYLPPLIDPDRIDPPGDNAVYVRDRLDGLEALWAEGFWEVEIHRALRMRGESAVMACGAAVVHTEEGRFLPLLPQRHAHARHYGASRARRFGTADRLVRIAMSPLVPAVLLSRIIAALSARGQSLSRWMPALPYLLPLLAAWSLGEACGMYFKHPTKRCWHGRQRTRGWIPGGGSRVPRSAAGGCDDGRARLPAGGSL